MKNLFKLIGFIALVTLIGFSIAACIDLNDETTSLDGVWVNGSGYMTVTVSGNKGIISSINAAKANELFADAVKKDHVKVGDQWWRNLTSEGNLTWSGQQLNILYYNSKPTVSEGTTWGDTQTITMSADGQTIEFNGTWTRQGSHSLNGTWVNSSGYMTVTVSGNKGTISSINAAKANDLFADAVKKDHVKVGDQWWQNLTSKGNLTWSGQQLNILYYNSKPTVSEGTTWGDTQTITMSADGQTIEFNGTWTRQ